MKTDKIDYFSHDTFAREDEKLQNLIITKGYEGLGVYWCIIEMLYESNGYLENSYERIAYALRTHKDLVKTIIEDFNLFNLNETHNKITSKSVNERIKRILSKSEKAKKSAMVRWNKKMIIKDNKDDANALPTHSERNASSNAIKLNKIKLNKIKLKCIYTTFEKLKSISEEDINQLIEKYGGNKAFVLSCIDDMGNWLEKKGRTGNYNDPWKNYLSALRDWVKKDVIKIKKEDYGRQQSKSVIAIYKSE
jgi:hypothetical protein